MVPVLFITPRNLFPGNAGSQDEDRISNLSAGADSAILGRSSRSVVWNTRKRTHNAATVNTRGERR